MYAYIDESGNTGTKLFDRNQPYLYALAISSGNDFDSTNKKKLFHIKNMINCKELHANKLGLSKINIISGHLKRIIKDCGFKFFFVAVEKKYVSLVRLYDCLFDPYDNKAVPWTAYNFGILRSYLLIIFSTIINNNTIVKFWDKCMMEKNKEKSKVAFLEVCAEIWRYRHHITDARAKKIISDALDWAQKNPTEIMFAADDKNLREMGAANFVAITSLIPAICDYAHKKKKKIISITHDEQNQFENYFKYYHDIMRDSTPYELPSYFGFGKNNFLPLRNSTFKVSPSESSNAIQIVDICLYLLKKEYEGEIIVGDASSLLKYIKKKGFQSEYTFRALVAQTNLARNKLSAMHISDEDMTKGKEALLLVEEKRQQAMKDYLKKDN